MATTLARRLLEESQDLLVEARIALDESLRLQALVQEKPRHPSRGPAPSRIQSALSVANALNADAEASKPKQEAAVKAIPAVAAAPLALPPRPASSTKPKFLASKTSQPREEAPVSNAAAEAGAAVMNHQENEEKSSPPPAADVVEENSAVAPEPSLESADVAAPNETSPQQASEELGAQPDDENVRNSFTETRDSMATNEDETFVDRSTLSQSQTAPAPPSTDEHNNPIHLDAFMKMAPRRMKMFSKASLRRLILDKDTITYYDMKDKFLGRISLKEQGFSLSYKPPTKSSGKFVLYFAPYDVTVYPVSEAQAIQWIEAVDHNNSLLYGRPDLGSENPPTLYNVLGLDRDASAEHILATYKPYVGVDVYDRVYQILHDSALRAEYDNAIVLRSVLRHGMDVTVREFPDVAMVHDPNVSSLASVAFLDANCYALYWADANLGRVLTSKHTWAPLEDILNIQMFTSTSVLLICRDGPVVMFEFVDEASSAAGASPSVGVEALAKAFSMAIRFFCSNRGLVSLEHSPPINKQPAELTNDADDDGDDETSGR